MLARFFIDRPIFAWVLSLVIILIGGVAAFTAADRPVSADHAAHGPGDLPSIPAPMPRSWPTPSRRRWSSRSTASKTCSTCRRSRRTTAAYTLTVTFEIGTDVNMAQVLVQNRVALAMPQLPAQVQLQGINVLEDVAQYSVRHQPRSRPIAVTTLCSSAISPRFRFRTSWPASRGWDDIKIVGVGNYSMRIWLDPYKLASRSLTAVDVVNAVQNQNVQVAAGKVGQQPVPQGRSFSCR